MNAEEETALDPEEFYRTNDMALVTYLKLMGHAVQAWNWIGDTFYWYFDKGDALLGSVDDFLSDAARVNPREYNKMFNSTKREFYDHNSDRPRRTA
jgi:hypothetical protein